MRQERIRTQFTPPQIHRCRARAFTLVEILVVITIIALLTSLLVVASMSVLGTSREAATKATLIKIGMLLDARKAAFNRYVEDFLASRQVADKTKTRKDLERKYFPQTWAEANTKIIDKSLIEESNASPGYLPPPPNFGSPTESSEVLYWVLLNTRIPKQEETISDAFLTKEYVVPPGTGEVFPKGNRIPYFVDSWGIPLRFYRWPTRLVRPHGLDYDYDSGKTPDYAMPAEPSIDDQNVAATLIPTLPRGVLTRGTPNTNQKTQLDTDPDDPLNKYIPGRPSMPGSNTEHDDWLKVVQGFETNYHTLGTTWTMLVVSAGADQEFGLHIPSNNPDPSITDDSKFGRLAMPIAGQSNFVFDNLTIQNIVAGASR